MVKSIAMDSVPDWTKEPSTPLCKWEQKMSDISIHHHDEIATLPFELYPKLKEQRELIMETKNHFNGDMVNVQSVTFNDTGVVIETKIAKYFDYQATSKFFRNNQGKNPIRPLAVQVVLVTPDGGIVISRRSSLVFDFPNKLSVFGGAMDPKQMDPKIAIIEILKRKWKIEVEPFDITATGMDRENVNNIFCIFFMVRLNHKQVQEFRENFKDQWRDVGSLRPDIEIKGTKEYFYEIPYWCVNYFLDNYSIHYWNPTGFTNLLYAFQNIGIKHVSRLFENSKKILKKNPF